MRITLFAAALLGTVGCGSQATQDAGPLDDGGANPFVGTWSCTETIAENGAGAQMSESTLNIVAGPGGQISETEGEEGGSSCVLTAVASGSSAILSAAQCTIDPGTTLDLATGAEAVSDGTLTVAFAFTLAGEAGAGTGTVSAVCTRAGSTAANPSCSPRPIDGGFSSFTPPNAPRSVCTPAQIAAYYAACWAEGWTDATCDPFNGDPANSPCINCLYSDANAKSWGAVVPFQGSTLTNIAGCIALQDGNTSSTGCAATYEAFQECEWTMCASCNSGSFDQCYNMAEFGVCATYAGAALCAQATEYRGCFFTDFESYFRGIGQLFCAAQPIDAGNGGDGTTGSALDAAGDVATE